MTVPIRLPFLRLVPCTLARSTIYRAIVVNPQLTTFTSKHRQFSSEAHSGGTPSDQARLPFSKSSLGLDRTLIIPYLDSIRQLPEVDAAWNQCTQPLGSMTGTTSTSVSSSLQRAIQIFESFAPHGGEHVAVQALLAEVQHRQGHYEDAMATLNKLATPTSNDPHGPHQPLTTMTMAAYEIQLAKAKIRWKQGHFADSQSLCESLLLGWEQQHPEATVSAFHIAAALNGKALSQLVQMDSMDEAFSVRDGFRVALKFLESQTTQTSHSIALAAAYSNAGGAEAIYNQFVQERNNVDVPMDSALKTWFKGLQKIEVPPRQKRNGDENAIGDHSQQLEKASLCLQASLQADLAWGVLNHEHDRKDRLSKASDYAKKALAALGPNSSIEDDGFRRTLAIVASCYHQAGSAVTAEGLYQSATSRKIPPSGPLQCLELYDAMLGYSRLLSGWDKRQGDADRLQEEASQLSQELLPDAWRHKSVVHSSLWFWTPADFCN